MSRLSVLPVTALPNRLGQLMDRYADNYWRLVRLFPLLDLAPGHYRSLASDGIELQLEVIERHSYTLELRLTYGLVDPISGRRDPSAMVRVYTDARLAEVTHCEVSQRWEDLLGLRGAARELVAGVPRGARPFALHPARCRGLPAQARGRGQRRLEKRSSNLLDGFDFRP
jgi:uncharacterized protein YqiB (DUF1249 family)